MSVPAIGIPRFRHHQESAISRKTAIVELKSLKLYINGYRDVAISHEAVTNKILDDLVALLEPHWMRVIGDFNVRGNIKTVVAAEHGTRG